jgi:hypothetical protein
MAIGPKKAAKSAADLLREIERDGIGRLSEAALVNAGLKDGPGRRRKRITTEKPPLTLSEEAKKIMTRPLPWERSA